MKLKAGLPDRNIQHASTPLPVITANQMTNLCYHRKWRRSKGAKVETGQNTWAKYVEDRI